MWMKCVVDDLCTEQAWHGAYRSRFLLSAALWGWRPRPGICMGSHENLPFSPELRDNRVPGCIEDKVWKTHQSQKSPKFGAWVKKKILLCIGWGTHGHMSLVCGTVTVKSHGWNDKSIFLTPLCSSTTLCLPWLTSAFVVTSKSPSCSLKTSDVSSYKDITQLRLGPTYMTSFSF